MATVLLPNLAIRTLSLEKCTQCIHTKCMHVKPGAGGGCLLTLEAWQHLHRGAALWSARRTEVKEGAVTCPASQRRNKSSVFKALSCLFYAAICLSRDGDLIF